MDVLVPTNPTLGIEYKAGWGIQGGLNFYMYLLSTNEDVVSGAQQVEEAYSSAASYAFSTWDLLAK